MENDSKKVDAAEQIQDAWDIIEELSSKYDDNLSLISSTLAIAIGVVTRTFIDEGLREDYLNDLLEISRSVTKFDLDESE